MTSKTTTQHTPGPWEAEPTVPSEGFDCWHITSPSGDIAWARGYQHEAEKQANARLFAAAPDLLAALKCFLGDSRFQVGVGGNPIAVDRMIAAAFAAVAKAEGTQV